MLAEFQSWGYNFRVGGIVFFLAAATLGLFITVWKHVPAPKGANSITWHVYLMRGVAAGIAVGSAVMIGKVRYKVEFGAHCHQYLVSD
jgi:hypothetical protein